MAEYLSGSLVVCISAVGVGERGTCGRGACSLVAFEQVSSMLCKLSRMISLRGALGVLSQGSMAEYSKSKRDAGATSKSATCRLSDWRATTTEFYAVVRGCRIAECAQARVMRSWPLACSSRVFPTSSSSSSWVSFFFVSFLDTLSPVASPVYIRILHAPEAQYTCCCGWGAQPAYSARHTASLCQRWQDCLLWRTSRGVKPGRQRVPWRWEVGACRTVAKSHGPGACGPLTDCRGRDGYWPCLHSRRVTPRMRRVST
jgi:hypothetical protein